MIRPLRLAASALTLVMTAAATAAPTPVPASGPLPVPLSWAALQALPLPPPAPRWAYGPAPTQFGELRVPAGPGPFPVMVLIHGGCWQNEFDLIYITRLGQWLADHGVASWTIEYARLGDPDGGWPGTFTDVARATDFLRELARTAPLDLTRVYSAGHSAGGQLALWLASRPSLPTDSPLYRPAPLPIRGVLGLAAITDLDQYRIGPADSCHAAVDPLLGGDPATVPERYAQTSPLRRLPLKVPQVFIQGDKDPIVDPASVRAYVDAARRAGDPATVLPLPQGGHFDTAVAVPASEAALREALRQLLSRP